MMYDDLSTDCLSDTFSSTHLLPTTPQDGAQLDIIGTSMLGYSNKMTDTVASLTLGFEQDILAAFDADVLQDAVQDIIDDATIRRPRRGGPGGDTMAALQNQLNKEAAAAAK